MECFYAQPFWVQLKLHICVQLQSWVKVFVARDVPWCDERPVQQLCKLKVTLHYPRTRLGRETRSRLCSDPGAGQDVYLYIVG